jgi:hypothetical protein
MGTRSLRGRSSGLRHFECGSRLLPNRWGAACNLKVEQQLNKISNPLQNEKKQPPNTEDNSNMWKQIADVLKYLKTNWVCEGGLEMVKNNEDDNVV